MKYTKKALALFLALCMIITSVPFSANAAETTTADDTLTASLAEAKNYIDALTINNASNDPATVVKNFGTHFTWDNEKRENSKSYLYDWSYYNGVVFEGLEYVYEITNEEVYKDYVVEYMSSLIAADGTWATCSNNSSKQCAVYNSTHGADCYKTASLLLDTYKMTGDTRYLEMAEELYEDLDEASEEWLLENAGYNYRHTWGTDSSPDLWLDGLYMILPFRAEYASYINDTEELDLIVDRMQWVSDNMYNESKGLFYHAADSASSNSGTYWLRSIGWYAAAIVDIMDSMEDDNLEAMKKQLVKLVDGMKAVQNASNGMWLNNLAASESSSNPYETSGTALICYAVMKAVNNGWLDKSYADMAILAFEGICNEKLEGTTLKDICFKGTPGSSNSEFKDNEGKGVGPFIMLYTEVMEYTKSDNSEEPEVSTPSTEDVVVEGTDTTITVGNITGAVTASTVEETDKEIIDVFVSEKNYTKYVAYDIKATLIEGTKALVSIPVPKEWNATEDELLGISVENEQVKEIKGTLSEDGIYSFEVDHFSAKGVAYNAKAVAEEAVYSATGTLVGEEVYTLDTNGVTADKNYLIVNIGSTGNGYALTNNNGTAGSTLVTVSNDSTITIENNENIAWKFSGTSSGTVGNNNRYICPNNGSLSLNENGTNLTISSQSRGAYKIYRKETFGNWWNKTTYYYYPTCSSNSWTGARTNSDGSINFVYLYEWTSSSAGEAVEFEITSASAVTMTPNGTHTLNGTVTVAGENVDLSKCTIVWSSTNPAAAEVEVNSGIVTGIAEGTTMITATLSAVNGTDLQDNIVLKIPVTVESKKVVSYDLTGNTPVTTKQNVAPDFSNIKLEVTYEDGTTDIITVENGLVIEGYDITTIGSSYATISYMGKQYGNIRVTIEGNPYEGLEDATVYPEYPADGAVRIDKTATANAEVFKNTGVTHVELDVAGISVKQGVDVVLVVDVSNSMGWSLENSDESADADKLPSEGQETKLDIAMKSASDFADILLSDNTGDKTDNTLSFVTFAGYDSEFGQDDQDKNNGVIDSLLEVFQGITSADAAKNSFSNTKFTSATTNYPLQIAGTDGKAIVNGNNRGDTNYDYAFWQTAQTVEAIKVKNTTNGQENREIYVIFMTDGAPSHYNNATRNGSSGREDLIPESKTQYYNQSKSYTKNEWYAYFSTNANTYAKKVYELVNGNFVGLGFDLAHGGFSGWSWTEEELSSALRQVAHDTKEIEVMTTADAAELNSFYTSLATKIKYAGTSAQVTDIIDNDFTLQMAATSGSGEKTATLSNFGITPQITVKTYDLYTKAETTDATLIGTRKGTSDTLETVTFSDDGTSAYSSEVDNSATNIMTTASDGTVIIEAHYFTYTKTPEGLETFKWTIGNITDKEIVLGFDAYLKESLEGGRPEGIYYTNKKAELEYVDVNGKYATQTFPRPAVSWGGASTTIRFYLVNEDGKPVNRAGTVVPMANCIYVGEPVTVNLNLNADATIDAQKIEAAAYVPSEYYLYDINASYTIQTASGDDNSIVGGITPSEPSEDATKTVGGKTQNGAQTTITIEYEPTYYTYSTVGFGVRWDLTQEKAEAPLIKDQIVIDYGKAIQVDVLANDPKVDGYNCELTGFVVFNANTDTTIKQLNAGSQEYTSGNGTYSIVDQKVEFQLHKMLSRVEKVFYVVKYTEQENKEDFYYLFGELDIIPATSVYYETSDDTESRLFQIETSANNNIEWQKETVPNDIVADGPQDSGTIGQNLYGFDSSYENDKYLSNGSSLKAIGQGVKVTTAKFSFSGTGFDLISRTGTKQGAIRVDIYSDAARTTLVKSITVLNKSESNLELYQIPVVSAELDTYGTYYVTIGVNAAFEATEQMYPNLSEELLESLSRGGEFFFDAIRVYNPVSSEDADYEMVMGAYMADGEAHMERKEVRAMLIGDEGEILGSVEEDENGEEIGVEGVVFVDRTYENDADGNIVETGVGLKEYTTIGPNNEVYLTGTQSIGFGIKVDPTNLPTSIDIGAKSVHGEKVTLHATVYVGDAEVESVALERTIESGTAQNYDLLDGKSIADLLNGETELYVMIDNTGNDADDDMGEGILSLTDLKIAYGNGTSSASVFVNKTVLDKTIQYAEGPTETVSYDVLSAEFTKASIKRNAKAKLIITTDEAVENLQIKNKAGRKQNFDVISTETSDGIKTWTVQYRITSTGTQTYTIAGYDADGNTGSTATASIKVTR